jgi:hypothetical protein
MKAFIDPATSITTSSLRYFVMSEQVSYLHIFMTEIIGMKQITPGDIVRVFFGECINTAYKNFLRL